MNDHSTRHDSNPPSPCDAFTDEFLKAWANGAARATYDDELLRHLSDCESCDERLTRFIHESDLNLAAVVSDDQSPFLRFRDRLVYPEPPATQFEIGDRIGPFEVVRYLGKGGSSFVCECLDHRMGRLVAVKVLNPRLFGDSGLARLELEARTLAQLDHPLIVKAFEIRPSHFPPYIVMELLPGGSAAALSKNGPLPGRKAAALIAGVARAVHHAHTRGIIHRDIKPSNLLMSEPLEAESLAIYEQTLKVSDFGLARLVNQRSSLTPTGQILGTPAYMSPEQAMGKNAELTPATDIYSLGVVLYEFLTGRPPLAAESYAQTLRMTIEVDPIAPRAIQPGIDRDLETICLKCLCKNPADRYETALEIAEELDRYLENRPIQARPVPLTVKLWRWARRNPGLASASASSLFLLVSIVALAVRFAIVQSDLRSQAEASAELFRRAANEAEIESDYSRNMFINGVRIVDKVMNSLESARTLEEVARIAASGRAMNQKEVTNYANRSNLTGELHGNQIDTRLRDAIALEELGYRAEAKRVFAQIFDLPKTIQPGHSDYERCRRACIQGSTRLAISLRREGKYQEAVEILTKTRKDFPLDLDQPNLDYEGSVLQLVLLDSLIVNLNLAGRTDEAERLTHERSRLNDYMSRQSATPTKADNGTIADTGARTSQAMP